MKRVLIISPYFPPSTLAGVHRARILSKHLPACGWEPIVFCVDHRYHEQRLDNDLAALVPAETRVIKVRAWPTKLSRAVGIGDLGIRGFAGLRRAVLSFIEGEGADLLFVTALPGLPLLIGPEVKRRFGIPFIADYQDPWLPRDFELVPAFTKMWLVNQIAVAAEPYVLRRADHVTSVSEGTNQLIRSRYSWMPAERFSAVPIGGDAADFEYLHSRARPCPWISTAPNRITISYVGNVWTRAYRTLEALFAAVAHLKATRPQLYDRLRLVFVGSSNQPMASNAEVVMPFARRAGIAEIVHEEPERVPYLDALNIMARSDILLMLGSDEPHYTASKLYPSLLAERPVLGLFHERSSLCSIAETVGGVMLVKFNDAKPVTSKIEEIAEAIVAMAKRRAAIRPVDRSKLEPYLGPAIARRFADIFDHVGHAIRK